MRISRLPEWWRRCVPRPPPPPRRPRYRPPGRPYRRKEAVTEKVTSRRPEAVPADAAVAAASGSAADDDRRRSWKNGKIIAGFTSCRATTQNSLSPFTRRARNAIFFRNFAFIHASCAVRKKRWGDESEGDGYARGIHPRNAAQRRRNRKIATTTHGWTHGFTARRNERLRYDARRTPGCRLAAVSRFAQWRNLGQWGIRNALVEKHFTLSFRARRESAESESFSRKHGTDDADVRVVVGASAKKS